MQAAPFSSAASAIRSITSISKKCTSDEVEKLATELLKHAEHPHFTEINISNGRLHDDGAMALATALRGSSFPALCLIRLWYCELETAGVTALADALRGCDFPKLRDVNVGDNPDIDDAGYAALASAMEESAHPALWFVSVCDVRNTSQDTLARLRRANAVVLARHAALAFMGATHNQASSPRVRMLLAKSGDNAVVVRTMRFMMGAEDDTACGTNLVVYHDDVVEHGSVQLAEFARVVGSITGVVPE